MRIGNGPGVLDSVLGILESTDGLTNAAAKVHALYEAIDKRRRANAENELHGAIDRRRQANDSPVDERPFAVSDRIPHNIFDESLASLNCVLHSVVDESLAVVVDAPLSVVCR